MEVEYAVTCRVGRSAFGGGLVVCLLIGTLAAVGCGPSSAAECRSDGECDDGEQCLNGGGVLFGTGGRCISLDAADGSDASDVGPDPGDVRDGRSTDEVCGEETGCSSDSCERGGCAEPSCSDGRRNQDETDVDCGGGCPGCEDGAECRTHSDCRSKRCTSVGVCAPASCEDGIGNRDETDVDCGGPNCPACDVSESCEQDRDCSTGNCKDGTCKPACDDGQQNQKETDTDCGGPNCGACAAGKTCEADTDCASGWCDQVVCTVRIDGELTADDPGSWSNGEFAGSCDGYEGANRQYYRRVYADVDLSNDGRHRNGIYKIKPPGASRAYKAYCQMLKYNVRGGWTLVAVSADDGNATWTWKDRALLTSRDTSTFGDPADRSADYKGDAFHDLGFEDAMFVYRDGNGNER